MALIDTSFLLNDPDFTSEAVLVRRTNSINDFGENITTETNENVVMVIQPINEDSEFRDIGGIMKDGIQVWHQGVLNAIGDYPDLILWNGLRYVVKGVKNWLNHGIGFCSAGCILETGNAE